MIVRTFDAETSLRTQFRHAADETIQRYADKLETSTETHVCAFSLALYKLTVIDLTRVTYGNYMINLTVFAESQSGSDRRRSE